MTLSVDQPNGGNHTVVIPARPTIYRGIRMRSRLEALWAAELDLVYPGRWQYEPICFADGFGQYLPDFGLDMGTPVYIEVKPPGIDPAGQLARMSPIWASEPEAELWLFRGRPPVGPWTDWYTAHLVTHEGLSLIEWHDIARNHRSLVMR